MKVPVADGRRSGRTRGGVSTRRPTASPLPSAAAPAAPRARSARLPSKASSCSLKTRAAEDTATHRRGPTAWPEGGLRRGQTPSWSDSSRTEPCRVPAPSLRSLRGPAARSANATQRPDGTTRRRSAQQRSEPHEDEEELKVVFNRLTAAWRGGSGAAGQGRGGGRRAASAAAAAAALARSGGRVGNGAAAVVAAACTARPAARRGWQPWPCSRCRRRAEVVPAPPSSTAYRGRGGPPRQCKPSLPSDRAEDRMEAGDEAGGSCQGRGSARRSAEPRRGGST